jgi:hypothetical protein
MNTRSNSALLLAAVSILVGCATTQQQAALECGAGGAAIGYLACKLTGRSDRDCAAIAAAGAVIGAAGCYTYQQRLEKRRKALAGREQDLTAQIQYVRGLNEDGQQLNAELRQRIDVSEKRLADLTALSRKQQATSETLANERKRLDDEVSAANKQVALQDGALTEAKGFQAKRATPSTELDAEIAKQERLLADAKRQVAALAQLRERVG